MKYLFATSQQLAHLQGNLSLFSPILFNANVLITNFFLIRPSVAVNMTFHAQVLVLGLEKNLSEALQHQFLFLLAQLCVSIPPEGAASHVTLVAAGEGIPREDRLGSGDHFVKVGIRIPNPKAMTRRQLELIRRFSQLELPPENGVVSFLPFEKIEADCFFYKFWHY